MKIHNLNEVQSVVPEAVESSGPRVTIGDCLPVLGRVEAMGMVDSNLHYWFVDALNQITEYDGRVIEALCCEF